MATRLALISGLIAAAIAVPGAAHAAENPQANPPTPDILRQTTSAMLQPADVPSALGGPAAQQIGYYIPAGGQDPYPICEGLTRRAVLPDLTMVTGYFSTVGPITQTVYAYPTSAAAQSSWSRLQRSVERGCTTSRSVDGNRTKITHGTAPAISGLWTTTSTTGEDPSGEYTQVSLIDNAVIALRVNDYSAPTTSAQRTALAELMQALVARYAGRETEPGVQSTALSIAETAMLTPADMPPTLPVRTAASGAWSSFDANIPGRAPFNQCNSRKSLMPAGTGSYSIEFGDDGGPVLMDGFAWQQVFTFADADAANAAWTALNRSWRGCNNRSGTLYKKTESAFQGKAGTSPVSVDGTAGLYRRYIETQGNQDKSFRWTTRTYQLFLKDGNVISSLTYGISENGITRITIDESAVNQLAASLLDRFVNTVVTTP